ncbi:MAG: hypothetical protein L0219_10800 [Phycisphaerales bacterium]|nr:hypothetical protein [Phycisphaerales bacterium]
MKRRLLKVGLLILAGAVVNVGVAWGLVLAHQNLWPPVTERRWLHFQSDDQLWDLRFLNRTGAAGLSSFNRTDIKEHVLPSLVAGDAIAIDEIPTWSQFHHFSINPYTLRHEVVYGWPSLAMNMGLESFHQVNGKIATPPGLAPVHLIDSYELWSRHFPRGVHLPGFAINTIFYAAILWLLFAAPGFVRRRRRIKRGLCPACAYPIGTSGTCTECGKPVPFPLSGTSRGVTS